MFLVHLPYYIKKAIRIHLFYRPWYQHCIIWVMDMRRNTSSGVTKSLFWQLIIKDKCNFSEILLWDIIKEKTKKDSNIVLNNGIHLRHIIYLGMCLIIQLYVCYCTFCIGPIIVLKLAVNGYLIPILKWRFHSHRIA